MLSTWGPKHGLPQMVLSRSAFGFLGNVAAGRAQRGRRRRGLVRRQQRQRRARAARAVHRLPKPLCLAIIVALELGIAFFGHNLIQAFERFAFPVLGVIFVIACVIALSKAHTGAAPTYDGGLGGFLIMLGATFGYAAGWNPYAADYSRYLDPKTPGRPVGIYAFLGVFGSCVLLETAGAAAYTAGASSSTPAR